MGVPTGRRRGGPVHDGSEAARFFARSAPVRGPGPTQGVERKGVGGKSGVVRDTQIEVRQELRSKGGVAPEIHPSPGLPGYDESRRAQLREMGRDGGRREPEDVGDLACTQLPLGKHGHDPEAGGVAQSLVASGQGRKSRADSSIRHFAKYRKMRFRGPVPEAPRPFPDPVDRSASPMHRWAVRETLDRVKP